MYHKWFGRALALAAVIATALMVGSCGAKRRLVSITVSPDNVTFGGAGLEVDYKALGNYENPTESRDITNSVFWQSAAPEVISIDPNTGKAFSGAACGANITITATQYANQAAHTGAAVVGSVSANVTCAP